MLCDAMRWGHLPSPGSVYQQNPELLDRFYYIFTERGKEEERKAKAEQNKGPTPRNSRVAGRRSR